MYQISKNTQSNQNIKLRVLKHSLAHKIRYVNMYSI